MAHPLVVHCKKAPYDVYIGRPSIWGHPFHVGRDGTRDAVIAKYRAWILTQPQLLAQLHTLRGKWLGKEMTSLSPPPRRTVRTRHRVHGSSNRRTPRGALLL